MFVCLLSLVFPVYQCVQRSLSGKPSGMSEHSMYYLSLLPNTCIQLMIIICCFYTAIHFSPLFLSSLSQALHNHLRKPWCWKFDFLPRLQHTSGVWHSSCLLMRRKWEHNSIAFSHTFTAGLPDRVSRKKILHSLQKCHQDLRGADLEVTIALRTAVSSVEI